MCVYVQKNERQDISRNPFTEKEISIRFVLKLYYMYILHICKRFIRFMKGIYIVNIAVACLSTFPLISRFLVMCSPPFPRSLGICALYSEHQGEMQRRERRRVEVFNNVRIFAFSIMRFIRFENFVFSWNFRAEIPYQLP